MELSKTGELIREARRVRQLTQRELAEQLHVTDRAVSKWERGLSAPDIGLLEPLGEALGLSVLELIRGERLERPVSEEATKQALEYSRQVTGARLTAVHRRYAVLLAGWTLIALVIGGLLLWRSGILFRVEQCVSPNGQITVSVYSKELTGSSFSRQDGTSLIEEDRAEGGESRINYGSCGFGGLWWSPDSEKYVIALEYPEETRLALHWLRRNSVSNLNAYLMMAVGDLEWKTALQEGEPWPEVSFQFLQWGRDGDAMLISYRFEEDDGTPRDGYFWYDCETGVIDGVLELNA